MNIILPIYMCLLLFTHIHTFMLYLHISTAFVMLYAHPIPHMSFIEKARKLIYLSLQYSGHGFLCVYSITYSQSFREVSKLHSHILKVKDLDYVPFVLAGNKCDLTEYREVPKADGEALAKKLGCKFMETSAKDRINVDQAFYELVREVKKYQGANASQSHEKTGDEEKKQKKGTCVLL